MVSKAFKLASAAKNTTAAGDLTSGVVSTYTTINDLPLSGNTQGDIAFVDSSNKLYFYRTEGWYRIELSDSAL
jgi:hypothetical protein